MAKSQVWNASFYKKKIWVYEESNSNQILEITIYFSGKVKWTMVTFKQWKSSEMILIKDHLLTFFSF